MLHSAMLPGHFLVFSIALLMKLGIDNIISNAIRVYQSKHKINYKEASTLVEDSSVYYTLRSSDWLDSSSAELVKPCRLIFPASVT
jgi:hypothetical protein